MEATLIIAPVVSILVTIICVVICDLIDRKKRRNASLWALAQLIGNTREYRKTHKRAIRRDKKIEHTI